MEKKKFNFKEYLKNQKPLFYVGAIVTLVCLLVSIILATVGFVIVNAKAEYEYVTDENVTFTRVVLPEDEEVEYDGSEISVCPVDYEHTFIDKENVEHKVILTVKHTYEEWEALDENATVEGRILFDLYENEYFAHLASISDFHESVIEPLRDMRAQKYQGLFEAAMAIAMFAIGLGLAVFFHKQFTTYEKIWFLSILTLAGIFSIIFPEESANGVNGLVIMLLYLLDTLFNILCELLISKQSRWNFIVSVLVEITEILICIVLSYRFATMATTLFFWLPVDIISFINWSKKPDQQNEEVTRVRTLKGWQEIVIICAIGVWTVVVGYFLSGLDIATDLFGGNELLENIVCYLDACASAVGIVNGLAILFRFREQWIAWYICSILEAVINILAGQYVLLVLKVGYLTNTTYGYMKWSKYIKEHPEVCEEKTFF